MRPGISGVRRSRRSRAGVPPGARRAEDPDPAPLHERDEEAVDGPGRDAQPDGELGGGRPVGAERGEQRVDARLGRATGGRGPDLQVLRDDAADGLRRDLRAVAQDGGGVEDVLELADVAGPVVVEEDGDRVGVERAKLFFLQYLRTRK